MSTAARTARSRRGRIMIVGDVPDAARYSAQLLQPPVLAGNMFDALGEVTVAPAGEPITTVIFSDRSLRSNDGHALEAIRKIDPSVRVVMIADSPSSAAQWSNRGLDDCVISPLRPEDLRRVFDEDLIHEPLAAAGVTQELPKAIEKPEPVPVIEIPPREPSAAAEPVAERPRTRAAPVVAAPTPSTPPPAPPADHGPRTARHLGDTDLVEAVMHNPHGVRDAALRLLAQQTGWNDVAFEDGSELEESAKSRIASTVAVHFNHHTFGRLRTAYADANQVQPWADWLARWLALDRAFRDFRLKAYQDDLTGAWNRRFFETFLADAIARSGKARRVVTLMVFDIDNFKSYNDAYGHEAGDEILRETVRLLTSVIRQGDRVCRIGGDEFAVIFADPEAPRTPGSSHPPPEAVEQIARRFQDQICQMRFPKLGEEAPGNLSISAGLATYPWDGADPPSLLRHADQLALESKRKGKNAITFGPGMHGSDECRTPSGE